MKKRALSKLNGENIIFLNPDCTEAKNTVEQARQLIEMATSVRIWEESIVLEVFGQEIILSKRQY